MEKYGKIWKKYGNIWEIILEDDVQNLEMLQCFLVA
jgi:hypothetical protein